MEAQDPLPIEKGSDVPQLMMVRLGMNTKKNVYDKGKQTALVTGGVVDRLPETHRTLLSAASDR